MSYRTAAFLGSFVALSGGPACVNCHSRVEKSTGWIEVSPGEACPPANELTSLSHSGELLSVDGEGVRETSEPAWQECCYTGKFVVKGEPFEGELCRLVEGGGQVELCPSLANAAEGSGFRWHRADALDFGTPEDQVQIESLASGPRVGNVSPEREICSYPITIERNTGVCG